jgi:hypothetical protein
VAVNPKSKVANCDSPGCQSVMPIPASKAVDAHEALRWLHGQNGWHVTEDGRTFCARHPE